MNKRIDYLNLGGFPLEQDTLDFMQQSYREALAAVAAFLGNKTIVTGVVVAGGNVSSGWIVYNGELIPFIGGVAAASVVITDTPAATQALFEDGTARDVYFTKTATCGVIGDFPFADLKRLTEYKSLQTTLEAHLAAYAIHTHAYNTITGRPTFQKGTIVIGDVSPQSTHTVAIPIPEPNNTYHVSAVIRSAGTAFQDNGITISIKDKTVNDFKILLEDFQGVANNIVVDWLIVNF